MSLQEIADAITSLEAVEHRLQLLEGAGGVIVIDDAYNANPAGVRLALEVLDKLPGGRKILITPGMVELGDHEEREHRQMGVLAADACDYVILVGAKRTRSIADGLQAEGFPSDHLAVVQDLDAATRHLQTFVQPGDVVLFENDLPDSYATGAIYF
jgi:UDP-N-acetylmuramoyl-tripeptide--D-alanyl-D-alanine ligase